MSAFDEWFNTDSYLDANRVHAKDAYIAGLKRAEAICRERADVFRGKNRVIGAIVCADAIRKEIDREQS